MKRCGIEVIEDGAFDRFESLLSLKLDENNLSTLPRIADDILSGLSSIWVNHNYKLINNISEAIPKLSPNYKIFFDGKKKGQISIYDNRKAWVGIDNLEEYVSGR